jgi:hypothetical protein
MKNLSKMKKKKTFSAIQKEAAKIPYTKGARFMMSLKGLKVFYKGHSIDKWELWALGYRSTDKLINNEFPHIKII